LPPYVLQQIAMNGAQGQRRAALTTLLLDDSRRTLRAVTSGQRRAAAPFGRPFGAVAGEGPVRTIFDAQSTQQLPGTVVRTEGQDSTGDAATDEAYDGLGATYDLYSDVFERDSIDDQGLPLLATVHYDEDYDNAFWDGTQMVFGDGDGELFNRFTISLDVIGHELAHGVTEKESGLAYIRQSGALNESMSDVFGSLVKQYATSTTAGDADWLIGAELFTDQVQGVALRSMKAPGTAYDDPVLGKDPQPAHMSDYVVTSSDNGGVHINSGIPNHAFYLVATELDGFAWERAGRIWYETLRSPRMISWLGFRGFASLTSLKAAQLYGPGSPEARAVRQAWAAVGLGLRPAPERRPGRRRGALAAAVGGRAVSSSSTSPWMAGAGGTSAAKPGEQEQGGKPTAAAQPDKTAVQTGKTAASAAAKNK
jgi:hypothetical protein